MQLAAATVDSTPRVGTYLGGYARLLDSSGVRDALQLGVLVVRTDRLAVILTLDLVFAHHRLVALIRARVRQVVGPDAAVMVCCSHSHSTPYGTVGAPAKRFQNYSDRVVELCVEATQKAMARLEPGSLHVSRASVGIGVNRRLDGPDGLADFGWNEAGPHDPEALIVSARSESGQLLGTVVNHACHPICLPPWSRDISGDWVGEMRREIAEATGAPCMFIQGACADINPRHEWVPKRGGPVAGPHAADTNGGACRALGGQIATAVLSELDAGEDVPDGPTRDACEDVWLALEPERAGDGALPYWHGIVHGKRLPRWVVDRLLARAFPWSTDAEHQADGWCVPLSVQALRIGGLAIAAHGSEPFCATGLAVKAASDAPFTLFAGYTNGMIGYVPPADELPRRGYEVETVPYLYRLPGLFDATAEQTAVAHTTRLLSRLSQEAT